MGLSVLNKGVYCYVQGAEVYPKTVMVSALPPYKMN